MADNAGNDPAGAGASSWIDIAPTNRWAMFDQALGSVTTDTSVITVTIAPAADIDAVALLDIDALAVRVEAPGYDQTKSTVVDGMKITRSEEHTSELQSLMRISHAVYCLKKKKK